MHMGEYWSHICMVASFVSIIFVEDCLGPVQSYREYFMGKIVRKCNFPAQKFHFFEIQCYDHLVKRTIIRFQDMKGTNTEKLNSIVNMTMTEQLVLKQSNCGMHDFHTTLWYSIDQI